MPSGDVRTARSVSFAASSGLCVSCLGCESECPVQAISYDRVVGLRRPSVDSTVCTNCGACRRVCPAVHLPGCTESTEPGVDWVIGGVIAAYAGHTRDPDVRSIAVSGGVATTLLESILSREPGTAVFGVPFGGASGTDADLVRLYDAAQARAAAGSKYVPVGIRAGLDALGDQSFDRVVMVLTPCALTAVLSWMRVHRISRERLLAIGVVCDRTLSTRAIDHLAWRHGDGSAQSLRYRSKRVGGWPGGVELVDGTGARHAIHRDARIRIKDDYRLRRCISCADKLNRDADIVLGDCYIPGLESSQGDSVVIVRTEAGMELVARVRDHLELTAVDVEDIVASQGIASRLPAFDRALVVSEKHGLPVGRRVDPQRLHAATVELDRQEAMIAYAETHAPRSVESSILLRRLGGRISRSAARVEMIGSALWTAVRPAGARVSVSRVDSVVVVGAGFSNRGAQALLFAVMDGVRARFPDAEVFLAYPGEIPGAEDRYRVRVLPWTWAIKAILGGWPLSRNARRWFAGAHEAAWVSQVLSRTACVIDVSGFRLSSEFGLRESLDYCVNVLVARAQGVPYHILPQSFGPMRYPAFARLPMRFFMRRALRSASTVWAREDEGATELRRIAGITARRAPDIVLAHRERAPERVYNGTPSTPIHVPLDPYVCVVPSLRIAERRTSADAETLYDAVIERVVASGRTVVLVSHSAEDRALCRELIGRAVAPDRVTLASRDLDALQLEALISEADFLIASRYHSVVHAYRTGVPAVVLGWAVKYRELAALVGQEGFVLPSDVDPSTLLRTVDVMLREHEQHAASIAARVEAGFIDAVSETVATLPA